MDVEGKNPREEGARSPWPVKFGKAPGSAKEECCEGAGRQRQEGPGAALVNRGAWRWAGVQRGDGGPEGRVLGPPTRPLRISAPPLSPCVNAFTFWPPSEPQFLYLENEIMTASPSQVWRGLGEMVQIRCLGRASLTANAQYVAALVLFSPPAQRRVPELRPRAGLGAHLSSPRLRVLQQGFAPL